MQAGFDQFNEAILPIHGSLTRSKILLNTLQSCQKLFQAEESAVLMPIPHAHELEVLCLREQKPKRIKRFRIARNHGIEWWLYSLGKPLVGPGAIIRLPASPALNDAPPHFQPQHIRSFMAIPLKIGSRHKGTLLVINPPAENNFHQHDLNQLRLLAQHTVLALENAADYESLRSLNLELGRQVKVTTAQLLNANETLRHANVAKSELISMVSHELRTPITAISGFAKLLLKAKTNALTDEQAQFFHIIQKHSENLERMITDLLEITKIEQGRLDIHHDRLSLNSLLNEAILSLHACLPDQEKRIRVSPSEEPAILYGDRMRLLQVINNFLTNALKYSPADTPVDATVTAQADQVCLAVENSGQPLTPDQLEKVFEKFFRIKINATQNIPGSGLGLAISKKLIQMHEGRIWAENRANSRLAFCFCLPRHQETTDGLNGTTAK
jgi:signal transduction histidine kinase